MAWARSELMPNGCELSTRTRIRAFRAQQNLLIVAEGELPTPGYRVDIQQDPRRIFPPQLDLLRCALPGVFPTVVTPFRYAETVPFPADPPTVTVHDEAFADAPVQAAASGRPGCRHPGPGPGRGDWRPVRRHRRFQRPVRSHLPDPRLTRAILRTRSYSVVAISAT